VDRRAPGIIVNGDADKTVELSSSTSGKTWEAGRSASLKFVAYPICHTPSKSHFEVQRVGIKNAYSMVSLFCNVEQPFKRINCHRLRRGNLPCSGAKRSNRRISGSVSCK